VKIFLGYASEHEAAARQVYSLLHEELRHEVWFDKVSLIGGDDWNGERELAQNDADFVVHLCSPEILFRKGVVNRELRLTMKLVEDQPFGAAYVVFLRVSDFRLPMEFRRYQWIDQFKEDWRDRLTVAAKKRADQLAGLPPVEAPVAIGETITVTAPLKTGVQSVEFSDSTKLFECSGNYLRYPDTSLYWNFVNAQIAAHALGEFFPARNDILEASMEVEKVEPSPSYGWGIDTEEFFHKDEIVSVRFYTSSYMGGAHPNHHITTLNFLGHEHGLVDIKRLLYWEKSSALAILRYCEAILKATFPDFETMQGGAFSMYSDDEEQLWQLVANYGVDAKGVTINFSPYDVLPYAFGEHEVLVPWNFIDEYLGRPYKDLGQRVYTPRSHQPTL